MHVLEAQTPEVPFDPGLRGIVPRGADVASPEEAPAVAVAERDRVHFQQERLQARAVEIGVLLIAGAERHPDEHVLAHMPVAIEERLAEGIRRRLLGGHRRAERDHRRDGTWKDGSLDSHRSLPFRPEACRPQLTSKACGHHVAERDHARAERIWLDRARSPCADGQVHEGTMPAQDGGRRLHP